jgi:WD40 repeat protein
MFGRLRLGVVGVSARQRGTCARWHCRAPAAPLSNSLTHHALNLEQTDKTIKFWTWTVTTEALVPDAATTTPEQQQQQEKKKRRKHKHDEDGDDATAAAAAAAAAPPVVVRRLGFKLARQLEMADDVLAVVVSPDGRLLAASLLDATIKVYYLDR